MGEEEREGRGASGVTSLEEGRKDADAVVQDEKVSQKIHHEKAGWNRKEVGFE